MNDLAATIDAEQVEPGSVAIYWLSQAGFVFKASSGAVVYIDPYFSDVVERVFGFKRMMSCPIRPEDVRADLIACTHEHQDHMDTDVLPILARKSNLHFAGPVECINEFTKLGIPKERCHLLAEGTTIKVAGVELKGVYADHGELATDAIGILLDFDGIRVYHSGDTAYREAEFTHVVEMRPHVVLPCINGRFGNMDAEQAARLIGRINPRVAIASHFWMFVEHGGDPASFLENCSKHAPGVRAMVMKPGERFVFKV